MLEHVLEPEHAHASLAQPLLRSWELAFDVVGPGPETPVVAFVAAA